MIENCLLVFIVILYLEKIVARLNLFCISNVVLHRVFFVVLSFLDTVQFASLTKVFFHIGKLGISTENEHINLSLHNI